DDVRRKKISNKKLGDVTKGLGEVSARNLRRANQELPPMLQGAGSKPPSRPQTQRAANISNTSSSSISQHASTIGLIKRREGVFFQDSGGKWRYSGNKAADRNAQGQPIGRRVDLEGALTQMLKGKLLDGPFPDNLPSGVADCLNSTQFNTNMLMRE